MSDLPFIPQMEPWFDRAESEAICDYMRNGGWVTEFTKTRQFEQSIADYTGAKYCSVVSNGTVSLTLALLAHGVGPGDEVIVPDYTMMASASAAILAGAEVVFADVEPQTLCLDLEAVKRAIGPRTRAIILVTINGRSPTRLSELVSLCAEKGLVLIEDAAQSLGSRSEGMHLGRFGAMGSFSFSAPKVITTGQGGALISDDEPAMSRIRKLRDFGRVANGQDHYLTVGWNFKFTDIQAVIGLEQMKKLDSRVERKKEIYRLYVEGLTGIPGIELIPTNTDDTSPWFVDVLVSGGHRPGLISHLERQVIGSRPFYPALHAEPAFNRRGESYPVAEKIAEEGLWLPSSAKLTDEDIHRVCGAIRSFFLPGVQNRGTMGGRMTAGFGIASRSGPQFARLTSGL